MLVSPVEAQKLVDRGYTYVDVRSELEFALGRPARAFNVPWQHVDGDRLRGNPEFIAVMCAVFRTDDPLIIGCRSGSRSRAASLALHEVGYTRLAQLQNGFDGARDDFGRRLPGWLQSGLPSEAGEPDAAHAYASLRARAFASNR